MLDTGIFDDDRYFDVFVEYAKSAPDDILIRITATNRGPDAAPLHLLPTLWFKNVSVVDSRIVADAAATHRTGAGRRPRCTGRDDAKDDGPVAAFALHCETPDEFLFTENDTNAERIFGGAKRVALM